AVGSTTLYAVPGGQTGLYVVSLYAKITRAATTSSSLTPNIGWTDGDDSIAVALNAFFAALTGNTTQTFGADSRPIYAKTGTNILYSTAYASVGGTSMQYNLHISVRRA